MVEHSVNTARVKGLIPTDWGHVSYMHKTLWIKAPNKWNIYTII